MKVLALSTSNSTQSINLAFAKWAANQLDADDLLLRDMNDYDLPIYSPQREQALGTPEPIARFFNDIAAVDVVIIGYAEHNGNFTAAWKNMSDWASRSERRFLNEKPVLALATSPGGGGAATVLALAKIQIEHVGGRLLNAISLPHFHEHYDAAMGQIRHESTQAKMKSITLSDVSACA